jgi:hypothetical protein
MKNKHISDSDLRAVFHQMPLDEPSPDFSEKLMSRIECEARRKMLLQQRIPVLQTAAAIVGLIILPAVVLLLLNPDFFASLSFSMPRFDLNFSPLTILVGLITLGLLLADMFFRKHYYSKR